MLQPKGSSASNLEPLQRSAGSKKEARRRADTNDDLNVKDGELLFNPQNLYDYQSYYSLEQLKSLQGLNYMQGSISQQYL